MATRQEPQQRLVLILASMITVGAGILSTFMGGVSISEGRATPPDYLLIIGGLLLISAGIFTLVVTRGWSLDADDLPLGQKYVARGTVIVGIVVIVFIVVLYAVSLVLMRMTKTAYDVHRFMESLGDALLGKRRRR